MTMEWENELKQDIPNVEKRIITNMQQVRAKIHIMRNSKKRSRFWLLGGIAVSFVIACSIFITLANPWNSNNTHNLQASDITPSELSGTIKTSYTVQGQYLQDYGDLINQHFPKLHVSISDPSQLVINEGYRQSYSSMIEEQNPDLIMISTDSEYKYLVQQGRLLNLDKYLERDHLDLSDVLPSSIQALKDRGNGSLYGLAPTFNSRSLIYNKTLFDQYHISYPTDQMSWDEILNLAKQFPKSDKEAERIYGFHEMYMSMFSPVYLINMIANTNGLQFMNNEATQVTMDSKTWNHAFHLALDGYQSGLLHKPATVTIENNRVGQSEQKAMDLFSQGKAAMTLDTIEFYNRTSAKILGFEVGIVTAPVSKAQPNTNTFFSNSSIFAINANAGNPDAAWEVIKYINSEAVAKLRIQTNSGLTTHLSVIRDLKYKNLDSFYKMDSASSTLYDFPDHLKMDFAQTFNSIIEEEVVKVMSGKQTVDEAQAIIQQREQNKLDKSKSE